MSKPSSDNNNGAPQRTVDIEAVLQTTKIPGFGKPKGADLFERTHETIRYVNKFVKSELWLYNRRMLTGPDTKVLAQDDNNNVYFGVNYASADYLGLAQNSEAKAGAIEAAKEFGMSSGGIPSTLGAHRLYQQLQKQLSDYWQTNVLIYPTGWMAGFGAIKGLVREGDFIIMDQISHNCLQEGAFAATKNVRRFEHLNQEAMATMVRETREQNPNSAILVITEGLFSMDADSPDVKFYQKITKQNGAFLLLDCAHDFGHLGHWGKGVWEVQGVEDMSNMILVGTGSKCLSTNIGFVGVKDPKVIEILRHSSCFAHASTINPAQAATSLVQLRILRSEQGVLRRKKVTDNYNYVRKRLEDNGRTILGNPGAILIVFVGNQVVCRLVSRIMMDMGVHVNGIEYPVVKIGQARLRVGLMPQHTNQDLDTFATIFDKALIKSQAIYETAMKEYMQKMQKQEQSKL